MAALQLRAGSWRILFRHKDKQYTFTIGEVSEIEAVAVKGKVEYLLLRIKPRLIDLPPGCDIVTFVQHDGKPPGDPPPAAAKPTKLTQLRDDYLQLHASILDPRTVADMKGHWKHLARLLKESTEAEALNLAALQKYVMDRVAEGVESATAKKEIVTLRTCWNWGTRMGMVKGAFPNKGLRFPKGKEKPPFMTFAEVARRIAAGEPEELWESVFLTRPEIDELLQCVRGRAHYPWVYPMFCVAAHTGARRSEMLRARVTDLDLQAGTVLIREKKRRRDLKESTRRLPLSPFLQQVLQDWLAAHPGGPFLFCHSGVVARSRKRSKVTGYKGDKTRPTTKAARAASLRERKSQPESALTRTEASDHFNRTLAGGNKVGNAYGLACAPAQLREQLRRRWRRSAAYRQLGRPYHRGHASPLPPLDS